MRGYYALIDDKAYELDKLNLTRASSILGEERGQTTVSRIPQERAVVVDITASHLSRSIPTNKFSADRFKEFLQDTTCTTVPKLSNHGKIYIEYSLRDDICMEVIDHGVGVADVHPTTFLFPLGLTEENEYVTRLGIQVKSKVTQRYKPKHPYSVMHAPVRGNRYTLFIQRIWFVEIMERAWSMRPAQLPKTHYYGHYHNCGCHTQPPSAPRKDWGNPYGMADDEIIVDSGHNCHPGHHHHHHHPSCGDVTYIPTDQVCDPHDMVVIFDTADSCYEDGIVQAVDIDFPPEEITINFTYRSVLPILISKEEITALLEENQKKVDEEDSARPIVPLPNPDGEKPEPPIEGDDKDTGDTGDTGNGGGDDGTGGTEPGVPDTPIEGDDKDTGDTGDTGNGGDGTDVPPEETETPKTV